MSEPGRSAKQVDRGTGESVYMESLEDEEKEEDYVKSSENEAKGKEHAANAAGGGGRGAAPLELAAVISPLGVRTLLWVGMPFAE